jgi:hypothetical protein
VKKCASCTKDLPDAALHCVFCGAKQPPAPAVQPGPAKTAFGYSANEVMNEINRQRPPSNQPPSNPANAATMFAPGPPPAQQPTYVPPQAPAYSPPAQPSYPQPGYPQPGYQQPSYQQPVPTAAPHAATHAVAPASAGMGIHSPQQITPQPLPTAPPPYLASQTATRAGRPIEPWKDALKIVMFIWGALTLAAFVTPMSINPTSFMWDEIIHASGTAKLPPLILGAVGVLALLLAAIPMDVLPRGILAAVLGLAGILVPVFLLGAPPWQVLLGLFAPIALVSGLLVRNEYVESLFARVLVTIGVICVLLPVLLPEHGEVPLVALFKGLLDAQGKAKIEPALDLGLIVIAVMSLLVWMPGPATGGAKVFAWLLILWPTLINHVVTLLVQGHIGDIVKDSPFRATMAWAPAAAYFVLVGYGLATVFGKQLE